MKIFSGNGTKSPLFINSNPVSADSGFAFEVKTAGADTFQLPLEAGGTYDFNVDWGDGSSSDITLWNHADTDHSYTGAGTYDVVITGTITGWMFNNHADASLVYEISSWGEFALLAASGRTFYGCSNMTWVGSAVGGFNTTGVTSMTFMFAGCTVFNQSISNFDTSNITNMYAMFFSCTAFNQPVSNFDTANVETMAYLFYYCLNFNQSVTNFDTAKVTTMFNMFRNCTVFNQSISNFDTAKVDDMKHMFQNCTLFNQTVANFDTANVNEMKDMFNGCTLFNQTVANFDTAKVTTMFNMFCNCVNFDQDISNFDISLVINATNMFLSVTLSTANYDALILAFSVDAQSIVAAFHGGSSKYTGGGAVAAARAVWAGKGWVLTDGGTA